MAVSTRSTLVAIFKSESDARSAAQDLQANGFASTDISMSCDAATTSGSLSSSSHPHHHEGGFTGWLKSLFGADDSQDSSYYEQEIKNGSVCLTVDVTDANIERAADILDKYSPRDIQRDTDASERTTSSAAYASDAAYTNASTKTNTQRSTRTDVNNDAQSIPVVEEELRVGKRAVLRGGVRVYSRVVEQPVEENVRLREEHVVVDRTPANRETTASDLRAGQEQVFEVKEYAEEPVISKTSRVVEDVRVRKEATERDETIRDTVRRTEVDVENLQGRSGAATSGTTTSNTATSGTTGDRSLNLSGAEYDASSRSTDFGTTTENYSAADYDTDAYAYGTQLASDPRYRGRSFDDAESDLRLDYGQRYPGSTWERVKASVRSGWDKATNKL